MNDLSIDFETRSTVDLRRTSVYVYAADPTTEVICMAWAIGDDPVQLWRPGDAVPTAIRDHVEQGGNLRAYNAAFERIFWRLHLEPRGFPRPALEQWYCTAAEAAALALPRGLGKVARVLNVGQQKDDGGHRLMLQMCKPRSIEPDGTIIWWDDEDRMGRLEAYCKQDVETERAVAAKLRRLGPKERAVYLLDQKVNDRGVGLDLELVAAMQEIVKRGTKEANKELEQVTDGAVKRVTKVADLTNWADEQAGEAVEIDNIRKSTVRDLLVNERETLPEEVQRALEIRQEAAKSSTAKLTSMQRYANSGDGRARGMLLYHGAGTGRWTGKGPQPQNFPRGEVKDPERYIEQVLAGDYDGIAAEHPPLVVASSLLRACFQARPGHTFIGGDYSQIEARVLGWYAHEPYGDREYERMAAAIFGVPVDEIENPSERRTIGKNTVLGCGYQMGAKTFKRQIWEQTGLRLDAQLADRAVDVYRSSKPGIPEFWSELENAAMSATAKPGSITHAGPGGCVRYTVRGQYLWCILPSGRPLAYALPRIATRDTKWGPKTGLEFTGVNGYTKKWETRHAYGGFLTENVVQATARDLLAEAMLRVEDAGYPVVLTVHDEILTEVPEGFGSVAEFETTMAEVPDWIPGLPVEVEAWTAGRYRK